MAFQANTIHEAMAWGQASDLARLIEEGKVEDMNKADGSGRTPLVYCVDGSSGARNTHATPEAIKSNPRLQKAKLLLDNRADPNLPDKFGWTVVHQCAWDGDLPLMEMVVRKGANVTLRNNHQQLPVELAAIRGYQALVRYLEIQACDLKSMCRLSIREAMGKRSYNQLIELPLPPTLKLLLNYGNPYKGWEATLIPPSPWSTEELEDGKASPRELQAFIADNASAEYLSENKDTLKSNNLQEMVGLFQSMYLWEEFKPVSYEEQLARAPRYSMERCERKDKSRPSQGKSENGGILATLRNRLFGGSSSRGGGAATWVDDYDEDDKDDDYDEEDDTALWPADCRPPTEELTPDDLEEQLPDLEEAGGKRV